MSFPRKKLDMSQLILEQRSCEVITTCARKFHPDWDFNRFEAIQCNAADASPEDGNRYDASYIFHISGPALDTLDREIPFLFPLERGKHYLWELFTELPKSGGSPPLQTVREPPVARDVRDRTADHDGRTRRGV